MSGTKGRVTARGSADSTVRIDLLRVLREAACDDDRMILAESPGTPDDLLTMLGDDSDAVRIRVAANPSTPAAALIALAHDQRPTVCAEVAGNPSAPDEAYRILIAHTYAGQYTMENPNCPTDLLLGIVDSPADQLRYTATLNPNCPPDLRERLLVTLGTGSNPHWRGVAGADERTPEWLRAQLAEDSDAQVRAAVKGRARYHRGRPRWPGDPAHHHRWCDRMPAQVAAAAIWESPPPTDEWPTLLAASAVAGWIGVLALTQFTRFVEVPHEWVTGTSDQRLAIAAGAVDDVEALEAVVRGSPLQVRCAVVRNPAAPVELLDVLARDSSKKVRAEVDRVLEARGLDTGWSGRTKGSAVVPLRDGPSFEIGAAGDSKARGRMARSLDCPSALLASLAFDRSKWVRAAVAANPSTPLETVVAMRRDAAWEVRVVVAARPECPLPVLSELSLDASVAVRRTAAKHPAATDEIRAQAALLGV